MDATRFDTLLRSLGTMPSRRATVRLLFAAALSGVVRSLIGLVTPEAVLAAPGRRSHRGGRRPFHERLDHEQKRRNKKKKKRASLPAACTPNCDRKICGSDGCGGSCGSCDTCQTCAGGTCGEAANGTGCGVCQACQDGDCVAQANGTACVGGFCQGGNCIVCNLVDQACCPGGVCAGGLECNVFNACGSCGAISESCCVGGTCDSGLVCQFGGSCETQCGGENSDCCFGGICGPGLVCGVFTGLCHPA